MDGIKWKKISKQSNRYQQWRTVMDKKKLKKEGSQKTRNKVVKRLDIETTINC